MTSKFSIRVTLIFSTVLCLALPLVGIFASTQPISRFLEFPPLTRYVAHAPFSLPIFLAGMIFLTVICLPLPLKIYSGNKGRRRKKAKRAFFPWWGKCGFMLLLVTWFLAWNRFVCFQALQPYTFTPLWLGYILTINGFTAYRTSACLMTTHIGRFFLLFPISAIFWWYFEYLNRFVQNWYYVGIENFTTSGYIIHASICFSTVLPAVISTIQLLATFPELSKPLSSCRPLKNTLPKLTGWLLLLGNSAGLTGLAIWPDYLFPLVWISPLLVFLGVQSIAGKPPLFAALAHGDRRPLWLPALAGLICGFLWEMWNWHSLAHWEYSVPFVNRLHIFAMPALGYGGYLPFGIECFILAEFLIGDTKEGGPIPIS